MRLRWRRALLVAALLLAHLSSLVVAQSDTESTTPAPSKDEEQVPTPVPIEEAEATPVPETEPPATDSPDTPAPAVEDTPPPETPSPTKEPVEETTTPVFEETLSPAAEDTPVPAALETAAPIAPETPNPTQEELTTPAPTLLATEEPEVQTSAPVIPTPTPTEVIATPATDPPTDPPTTEAPIVPATDAPIVPQTQAPVVQDTEAPAVPQTEAPVAPDTEAPVVPQSEAPVAPETGAPVVPQTEAPVVPQTEAPDVLETEATVAPVTLTPVEPETAAPVTPATAAPVTPETTAPVTLETAAPLKPDTEAPIALDSRAPVAPETAAPVTPQPTPRWTFAPADPWTESPGATPAPVREWTAPPTEKITWAPVAPWTASPGATPAPVREWTAPPTEKITWAPAAPWTASPGATPAPVREWTAPPTEKITWAPATPWTPPPTVKQTWAPVAPWTPPPTDKQTWAPIAPWTESPGATPAPVREWTAPPTVKRTWAPVAPWTAAPGATWAPAVPWTPPPTVKATWAPAVPWTPPPTVKATWAPIAPWTPPPTVKATWAPVAPWTASPGATWAPVVPWTPPPTDATREIAWTPPPTVELLDLVATTEAANAEEGGAFEGRFDTVLAAIDAAGLTTVLQGDAVFTLFLPTDDAFEAANITTASVTSLPVPVLTNLLFYHFLEGAASAEVVANATDFFTVLKVPLTVDAGTLVDGEGNSRSIVGEELLAKNGYAHAIDGILFPADLVTLADNMNAPGGSFEGVFDIFLAGVERVGLTDALSGVNGPYTVFAPADFAFESIGITNETVLTFDPAILGAVLRYHVISGEVNNATLHGPLREYDTLVTNRSLRNSRQGDLIDETGQVASALAVDLQALNGYLHAIDFVLEPYPLFTQAPTSAPTFAPTSAPLFDLVQTLKNENQDPSSPYFEQFDTIIAALAVSGLDLELAEPNGPFTVFAPTDVAFMGANLGPANVDQLSPSVLESLLLYHTLNGRVRRADIVQDDTLFTALEVDLLTSGASLVDSQGNTVNLDESDVACSNGYLHYVDGVLMPPDLTTTLEVLNADGGSYEGLFTTFMEGMRCVDMMDEMTGLNGPFTVLLPVENAFGEHGLTPDNICSTNLTALDELLHYHVVDGMVSSAAIGDQGPLGTQGITVSADGEIEGAVGGEATILAGDLASSNGMIHAIDSVLLPFPLRVLSEDMFGPLEKDENNNDHVEVAALSAGLAAALILVAAAIAVHKRRQADAAKPPQVAPDDGGWSTTSVPGRGAAVHPA